MFVYILEFLNPFKRLEKLIMANFDKLQSSFDTLSLNVRNAMDEIIELTEQVLNDTQDQTKVDALTTQVQDLAQKVKDTTDASTPAPAPTPTEPPVETPPAA